MIQLKSFMKKNLSAFSIILLTEMYSYCCNKWSFCHSYVKSGQNPSFWEEEKNEFELFENFNPIFKSFLKSGSKLFWKFRALKIRALLKNWIQTFFFYLDPRFSFIIRIRIWPGVEGPWLQPPLSLESINVV